MWLYCHNKYYHNHKTMPIFFLGSIFSHALIASLVFTNSSYKMLSLCLKEFVYILCNIFFKVTFLNYVEATHKVLWAILMISNRLGKYLCHKTFYRCVSIWYNTQHGLSKNQLQLLFVSFYNNQTKQINSIIHIICNYNLQFSLVLTIKVSIVNTN